MTVEQVDKDYRMALGYYKRRYQKLDIEDIHAVMLGALQRAILSYARFKERVKFSTHLINACRFQLIDCARQSYFLGSNASAATSRAGKVFLKKEEEFKFEAILVKDSFRDAIELWEELCCGLTDFDKRVASRTYIYGWTQKEIGEELKINQCNVYYALKTRIKPHFCRQKERMDL